MYVFYTTLKIKVTENNLNDYKIVLTNIWIVFTNSNDIINMVEDFVIKIYELYNYYY